MNEKMNFSDIRYNFSKKLVMEMEDIISSDINIYSKVEKIFLIYPNVTSFINAYYGYLKRIPIHMEVKDKELNNSIKKIIIFYKKYEQDGTFREISKFYKTKNLREILDYAKYIIFNYINSENVNLEEFLNYYGIDNKTFEYCVASVEEFDLDLYQKYLSKNLEIKEEIRKQKQAIMHDLYIGITTGKLSDETKFDLLEFIKRLPFKKVGKKFCYEITNFLRKNNPDEEATIMMYIKENGLDKVYFNYGLNINSLYQTKCIINGRELTNEEIDLIIAYLKQNNIPVVSKTYILARNKYLNNEIDLKNITINDKEKPLERTLIP